MSKISKEEQARRAGMAYALKIAKEQGIEELEKELYRRNVSFAPLALPRKELDEFTMRVKENVIDTVVALSSYILHDKFGYGEKRLERFIQWFNYFADSICNDWFTWDDLMKVIKEETGVELRIRTFNEYIKIK